MSLCARAIANAQCAVTTGNQPVGLERLRVTRGEQDIDLDHRGGSGEAHQNRRAHSRGLTVFLPVIPEQQAGHDREREPQSDFGPREVGHHPILSLAPSVARSPIASLEGVHRKVELAIWVARFGDERVKRARKRASARPSLVREPSYAQPEDFCRRD